MTFCDKPSRDEMCAAWLAEQAPSSCFRSGWSTRDGGHYIHAEKLRNTNSEATAGLARPGRYRTVAGNLRVDVTAIERESDLDGK